MRPSYLAVRLFSVWVLHEMLKIWIILGKDFQNMLPYPAQHNARGGTVHNRRFGCYICLALSALGNLNIVATSSSCLAVTCPVLGLQA